MNNIIIYNEIEFLSLTQFTPNDRNVIRQLSFNFHFDFNYS